jgi:threonine/homoserine/homoserine lactone efflux protein
MVDTQTLLLFSIAVLALLFSPGPNMAFLLSHGISHGVRGGVAVAFGIFFADLILTAITAAGVTAAIAAWPASFDLIRYCGIVYLLWLAIQSIRQGGVAKVEEKDKTALWRVVRLAMLNSLLNPKALLFFIVFLPQFVQPTHGNVSAQLFQLGIVLSFIALAFHCILGLLSGRVAKAISGNADLSKGFAWLHSLVFVGLAIRLMFLERPIK